MDNWRSIVFVLMLCAVLVGVLLTAGRPKTEHAGSRELSFASGEPAAQKDIVTAFKGDAKLSRAFAWHTENTDEDSLVQIVKGDAASAEAFAGAAAVTFEGTSSETDVGAGRVEGVHKAEATGLEPGTVYSYRVGGGAGSWSEPKQFVTAPEDENGFSFISVTDSERASKSDFQLWGNTLKRAFGVFPDARFIVHSGDLTGAPDDGEAWDAFFAAASEWVESVPLMPAAGNNDESAGGFGAFASHFNVPDNGTANLPAGTNYSFDYGSAHIVVLNTETKEEKQTKWLRDDLADTDKPWKIVVMHRPVYGGSMYKKVKVWADVFDEFAVDLVLQGHNHEYSRSYPLRGGEIAGDGDSPVRGRAGTVYVVMNASGPKFNAKKEDRFYHKLQFQNGKQMFAGITVKGDKLTYQAYDVDGEKLDDFVIEH